MTADELLTEIRAVFLEVAMPSQRDLRFHPDGCYQCTYLSEYLDEARGRPVDGTIIRYMHQEMSCLSAQGWVWALPHYLPFCFTPEAEYNQMETEFLIYNLGPSEEFRSDQRIRLSALTTPQLGCIVLFLEWLQQHRSGSAVRARMQRAKISIRSATWLARIVGTFRSRIWIHGRISSVSRANSVAIQSGFQA